ncbi:MAG: methyltransferase family protein [Saprospiraceae bacterium]
MNKINKKDLYFVFVQFALFVCYLFPVGTFSIQAGDLMNYIGLSAAIAGLLIIVVSIIQLNKNLTPFPTPLKDGTLIQNGLYKYARHPIYTGIILFAIGLGLFLDSIWKIGIGFALTILFYFKSNYEEKLLMIQYPDYLMYQKRTARFFPFF